MESRTKRDVVITMNNAGLGCTYNHYHADPDKLIAYVDEQLKITAAG